LHQRRQLPGEQREVTALDPHRQQALAQGTAICFGACRGLDLDGPQFLAAQLRAHLALGVGFEYTAHQLAAGIQGAIAVRGHGKSGSLRLPR
jgi:hypothetical protein